MKQNANSDSSSCLFISNDHVCVNYIVSDRLHDRSMNYDGVNKVILSEIQEKWFFDNNLKKIAKMVVMSDRGK